MPAVEVKCEAPGCKNVTRFRSKAWTKNWLLVWVEDRRGVGRSYQVCSELCAKIVKQQKGRDADAGSGSVISGQSRGVPYRVHAREEGRPRGSTP